MNIFASRIIKTESIEVRERYGFVTIRGQGYYISEYQTAENVPTQKVIIICDAMWDAQERSLNFNAKLSRELARLGYTVIRFDYTGTGNSKADSESISFDTLGNDVYRITTWVREQYAGAIPDTLICENFGCHIIFKHPEVTTLFKKLVFIHPISNLAHYFKWNFIERECLNRNLVSEKTYALEDLIAQINSEETIDLCGYTFNTPFVTDILFTKGLWDIHTPDSRCLYLFDETFYRNKAKWGDKIDNLQYEVIRMNDVPISSWDREDFNNDQKFYQEVLRSLMNFLQERK